MNPLVGTGTVRYGSPYLPYHPYRYGSPYLTHISVVLVLDADLVIAVHQVQQGKDTGARKHVEHVINLGNRISVVDSQLVQGTIVHAHAESAICLANE